MVRFTRASACVLAEQVVHTSGLNVESLAVIFGGVAAMLTVGLAFVDRRARRREQALTEIKSEITGSVDHLSEVLLAKLETKENVAQINSRLSRIEGMIGSNA